MSAELLPEEDRPVSLTPDLVRRQTVIPKAKVILLMLVGETPTAAELADAGMSRKNIQPKQGGQHVS